MEIAVYEKRIEICFIYGLPKNFCYEFEHFQLFVS